MGDNKNELLERLKSSCVIRGDARTIYPKGSVSVPKTSSEDWLLDFRRAFLDSRTANLAAREFWDAYAAKFPFQIAVVEMATVPLVGSLLAEGLSRGFEAKAIVIRKSRKKDGLSNILEGEADPALPTVVVDDIVNSGRSLVKAALTAKNEGLRVVECFCYCNFENPDFAKIVADSPFDGLPVRSVFTLQDFGLARKSEKPSVRSFVASSEIVYGTPEPHLGLVVPKSSPLLDGDALYVAGESGEVVKISLGSKTVEWRYSMEKTSHGKNVLSNVADAGDEICFGAYDGAAHFVNKTTGKKRLAVSLAEWIGGTPEIDLPGNRAFVGLEHGGTAAGSWSVAAFRISDGEILWENAFADFVHASPAYCRVTNSVYCGTNGGEFARFDAETGEIVWKRKFGGAIKTRATVSEDGSKIFFGCFDGMLRCLDAESGGTLWEFATPFNVYSEALAFGQGLFIWCSDKKFYHFDWNGTLVSSMATWGRIFAKPSVFREKFVAFGSNDGRIRFYDPETKAPAFEILHSERIVTAPAFRGNYAYFEDFADRIWEANLGKLTNASNHD